MKSLRLALLLAANLGLTVYAAPLPQNAGATSPTGGARTYLPAEFEQFAPQTALDMLSRVPGFSIKQEDQERGLGQATGNVLVNGQRISGKSNDVLTELGRIPAKNVQRIEIVDGATLDIPGLSGQVANVIVRSSAISGQYAYRPEFRQYFSDPLFTRFEVSANGTTGPVEYTFGLDNRANRSGAGGPTRIYSPAGELIGERDDRWRGNAERPRLSGKFAFDGPGTSIGNLNLSYTKLFFDYLETGDRSGEGLGDRRRQVTIDEEGDMYEIGGDYEFPLGRGHLKLIGVTTGSSVPSETNVITTFADQSPTSGSRFAGSGEENEMIGRSEYRWKSGVAEWQISGEAAFNSLDNTAQLFVMGNDGVYDEIELPGATARVEEDRYEIMGSFGRPLTPAISIKLSAGGEYSQLGQAGSPSGPRNFYRPKGEFSAAWKASPVTDVNFKLARRVGQLNFYDFLASVNLRDDVQTSANPDLVPQQSWELDAEVVRNLGSLGSTTARAYGRLIDDIIDYIPIGETGESPGNLDQAIVYGFESRSTFNLDRMGWKGARLDAYARFEDSEVEDPLTGEKRPISNNLMRDASLELRHDITGTEWAWGGGASYSYYAMDYRLTEVGRFWEGPVWGDLYLEHKDVYGLTIRGGIYNLFGADSMWDRTVYDGRRTDAVAFVERRDRTIGPIYSFSFRGKF